MIDRLKVYKLLVDNYSLLIREDVLRTYFQCDYEACQGACCSGKHPTEKLAGAPLIAQSEELALARADRQGKLHHLKLVEELPAITQEGFVNQCIDGRCIFAGENGCTLKQAKNIPLDIPLSCELYPLEIGDVPQYLHKFDDRLLSVSHLWDDYCQPNAEKLGRENNMPLVKFAQRALTRVFGESITNIIIQMQEEYTINKNALDGYMVTRDYNQWRGDLPYWKPC